MTSLSIALVWFTDVFGIVSLASRAVAAYHLSQTLLATVVLTRGRGVEHRRRRLCGLLVLMAVTAFVTVFAIPSTADRHRDQISTWVPTSSTWWGGRWKKRDAFAALRFINANRRSRAISIPSSSLGVTVSLPMTYVTSSGSNS